MILVTGATGIIGRRVVEQLVDRGRPVRATSRAPSESALPHGVDAVPTDSPADRLLAGCESVLVVASALGSAPATRLTEFIDAANDAGTARLVQLSTASATDPHSPTGAHHRALEEASAGFSGRRYVLRPVPFALNTAHWWSPTIRAGSFADGPYLDVPMAPVDERDVADVAARLLVDADEPAGSIPVTGPEVISSRQQLEVLAQLLGVAVTVREISPDEVRRRLMDVGVPRPAIDSLLRSFESASQTPVRPATTVERITGRPARTYAEWAADNIRLFR